jgi:hypothetical protein
MQEVLVPNQPVLTRATDALVSRALSFIANSRAPNTNRG